MITYGIGVKDLLEGEMVTDRLRDSAPILRAPYSIRSSVSHYPSRYVYGGYLRHMANRHLAVTRCQKKLIYQKISDSLGLVVVH